MEFIKQYFKIVNYALMGLIFMFAGFYLLVNAYHYLEIRKDYITDVSQENLVINLEEKLNSVLLNVASFNVNDYNGGISSNQMAITKTNLTSCVNQFRNETYNLIKNKDRITIVDVYNLRESYENNVLSKCIVNGLYWTTMVEDDYGSKYLFNNKDVTQLYVSSLLSETSYLKKDLLNNSSYFFNTSIASSSLKNNTKDGFYEVMSAYNKAADFVQYVSVWFKNEVEGNYD